MAVEKENEPQGPQRPARRLSPGCRPGELIVGIGAEESSRGAYVSIRTSALVF